MTSSTSESQPSEAAEAARYALLRRLAPSMRHHLVVNLQPIGMIYEVMERRLRGPAPDFASVHDSAGKIHGFAKAALQSCVDVVGWLAPDDTATCTLQEAVHECMGMLATSLSFRGYALRDRTDSVPGRVRRSSIRHLLTATLIHCTDGGAAPAELVLTTAPEADAAFPLRYLAVREDLVAGECAAPGADAVLDRLRPVPRGHRLLPVHPWQFELLGHHPVLRAALERGEVTDLGTGGPPFAPTASVRTLYGGTACPAFLKFSLNVRITNCVRKNARYELAGAVVQVQQTVRMAVRDLGDYIEERADDGSRTGTGTFIVRPRSFLIAGSLSQLLGQSGGPIDDKVHSFELFRRNLHEPELITFDELLARAEWHVKLAEDQAVEIEERRH